MIRKLYKWKNNFALNLYKQIDNKRPRKKNAARNRHWNGILAILLVDRGITPPPQPIRMRVANAFEARTFTIWSAKRNDLERGALNYLTARNDVNVSLTYM